MNLVMWGGWGGGAKQALGMMTIGRDGAPGELRIHHIIINFLLIFFSFFHILTKKGMVATPVLCILLDMLEEEKFFYIKNKIKKNLTLAISVLCYLCHVFYNLLLPLFVCSSTAPPRTLASAIICKLPFSSLKGLFIFQVERGM